MADQNTPPTPKTYADFVPDPDQRPGTRGGRMVLIGILLVAVLSLAISLFSLLFAPQPNGTPTPIVTATDRILSVYQTATPTPTR